jgi:mRNA interferase MazF
MLRSSGRNRFMQYPKRGEVYLVSLPAQPKDIKARPAIVISLDVRNRLANDVIVVPITATMRPSPTHVELPKGEGGLNHISMAKCEQITTLEKSFLIRGPFSGVISSRKIGEIEQAIQVAIGMVP